MKMTIALYSKPIWKINIIANINIIILILYNYAIIIVFYGSICINYYYC